MSPTVDSFVSVSAGQSSGLYESWAFHARRHQARECDVGEPPKGAFQSQTDWLWSGRAGLQCWKRTNPSDPYVQVRPDVRAWNRNIHLGAKGDGRCPHVSMSVHRSPEVMLILPLTEAIDVWSLGCLAAALLVGNLLYSGQSDYDIVRASSMQGLCLPLLLWRNSLSGCFLLYS